MKIKNYYTLFYYNCKKFIFQILIYDYEKTKSFLIFSKLISFIIKIMIYAAIRKIIILYLLLFMYQDYLSSINLLNTDKKPEFSAIK